MEIKKNNLIELNQAELTNIEGGTWLSVALGFIEGTIEYLGKAHAQSVMDNDNAPAVLAYK
jgi:hypothetical protein